jgi:hypothetical protein
MPVCQSRGARGKTEGSREPRRSLPPARANVAIADIVRSGALALLCRRLAKHQHTEKLGSKAVRRLVGRGSLASALALWAARRLATRSPLGLALVVATLAAKLLYDRGKRIEAERRQLPAGKAEARQA